MTVQNKNEINGYSLFNDIEDKDAQAYNRARIMFNILEDNADKERNVSLKGTSLAFQYFGQIVEADRVAVHGKLVEILAKRNEKK